MMQDPLDINHHTNLIHERIWKTYKMKFHNELYLSIYESLLRRCQVEDFEINHLRESIAVSGFLHFAGYKTKEVFEVPYIIQEPSNWWQMLKRDHFPQWWLLRWPVKTKKKKCYTKFTIDFQEYWPAIDIPDEALGWRVRMAYLIGEDRSKRQSDG